MLNLSDKELDRLARDAANEYDPGNLAGPGSWGRMQGRLDNELGYPRLNVFRSIRRIPFYYATAILLLVGVSYFLLKPSNSNPGAHPPGSPATAKAEPSGSPPIAGATPAQPQTTTDKSVKSQNNKYRSTSTPPPVSSATDVTTHSRPEAAIPSGRPASSGQTNALKQTTASGQTASSGHTAASEHNSSSKQSAPEQPASQEHSTLPAQLNATNTPAVEGTASTNANTGTVSFSASPTRSRGRGHQHNNNAGANSVVAGTGTSSSTQGTHQSTEANLNTTSFSPADASPSPLSLSVVRGIQPTRQLQPVIDDAGLRKLGAKIAKAAEPVNPGKKKSPSLHIDRPLQIGISLAPDFTSVNSLAGDKPGSTFGLTADYQLIGKWHIHTGFLLSHKNYTASQEDYHVPYDYYRMNNMHDVYFVKGTVNLFEIPLNLRYDFSVSGNTTFFVSGGLSSYLLTHENCNYYFDLFGRTVYQEFKYDGHQNTLFSTVDLSMGVETGLTNSLSLLIAPYMKIPTSGIGFGNIEMNSVGVEFGLKYAPVLRRRRH